MNITEILAEANKLSTAERLEVIKQLLDTLHIEPVLDDAEGTPSLLDLEGLGKEIWAGIDAQSYVDQLRDEWDHRP